VLRLLDLVSLVTKVVFFVLPIVHFLLYCNFGLG